MHVLRRTPVHKPVNDRLMIPLATCSGVLYVKRNGAVPPQRSCFRFAVLSSLQRGNCVKQIVKLPALNLSVSTGLMLSGMNIQYCSVGSQGLCFYGLFAIFYVSLEFIDDHCLTTVYSPEALYGIYS